MGLRSKATGQGIHARPLPLPNVSIRDDIPVVGGRRAEMSGTTLVIPGLQRPASREYQRKTAASGKRG